jgi:hypothetical protein
LIDSFVLNLELILRYHNIKIFEVRGHGGDSHSFWTHDGSILVKERENSKVKVIKNQSDVDKME